MNRSYFNNKADIWDEKIAEKDRVKLNDMTDNLEIEPGATVLDVGTGTGIFVPFLLKVIGPGGKLVCLDSAEKMIEIARKKKFKGNIEYICADIHSTDFENEVFDAVVCYSSFPHFHNKSRALKEINRVLKKGGKLFICHTSSRFDINTIHQQIQEVRNDLIPDKEEMRSLLLSAGFDDIEIHDEASSYFAKAEKLKAILS
jgi:ubiquinone/menaquinone biosynthesis C-methylase UbiE